MKSNHFMLIIVLGISTLNALIIGNFNTTHVYGEINPIIYIQEKEMTIYQGSSTTLNWIVIDTDPKTYFITNTNNFTEEEVILRSSRKFTNSKISINPVGIPVGENTVTLYVTDYTNYESSASIKVTVIPVSASTVKSSGPSTQPTATSTETSIATPATGLLVFTLLTLFFSSFFMKRKRKENEK